MSMAARTATVRKATSTPARSLRSGMKLESFKSPDPLARAACARPTYLGSLPPQGGLGDCGPIPQVSNARSLNH